MPTDPAVYARVFEGHNEGVEILQDLVSRFADGGYVRGGVEAERETTYRLGQRRVLDFILGQIDKANNPSGETNEDPA